MNGVTVGFKSFKEDKRAFKIIKSMEPFDDSESEFKISSKQPSHDNSVQN